MVLATGCQACTCFISEAADTRFLVSSLNAHHIMDRPTDNVIIRWQTNTVAALLQAGDFDMLYPFKKIST